ncbi:MAG: hypothetical protein ACK5S0_00140 [bacterium]
MIADALTLQAHMKAASALLEGAFAAFENIADMLSYLCIHPSADGDVKETVRIYWARYTVRHVRPNAAHGFYRCVCT